VRAALDPELPGVPIPVDIEVDCYFDSRAQDSDNILAKPMIDALKGWVVPQDDPAIVPTVSVTSFKDKENPRVVIRVISLPGSKPWDEKDPNYVDVAGKEEV
jgi:Holliday junction resolvase RusA-like endonuclease